MHISCPLYSLVAPGSWILGEKMKNHYERKIYWLIVVVVEFVQLHFLVFWWNLKVFWRSGKTSDWISSNFHQHPTQEAPKCHKCHSPRYVLIFFIQYGKPRRNLSKSKGKQRTTRENTRKNIRITEEKPMRNKDKTMNTKVNNMFKESAFLNFLLSDFGQGQLF